MSVSVDTLYKYCLFVARKNQAGGIQKSDFQFAYNAASKEYFDDLAGRYQRVYSGKSGVQDNETIVTKLSPFIKFDQLIAVNSGVAAKPTGIIRLLAMRSNGIKVFRTEHDKLHAVLNDPIDPPSAASPYYVEYEGNYKIYPSSITSVNMDYLVMPVDVVWGNTTDGNGRYVYDSATSTNPEWLDDDAWIIAGMALKILGVSYNEQMLAQYGDSINAKGE